MIAVCVDDRAAAERIVELCQHEFPQAELIVRAFDRGHALDLVKKEVAFQIRETFESGPGLRRGGVGASGAR